MNHKCIADSYTKQDPAGKFYCSGSPERSGQFKLCGHKLVVTGRDPIPLEINKGIVIRRCDLKTVQEETDVIMSQQMIANSEELDEAGIRVMFDDDVFSLCCCCISIFPSSQRNVMLPHQTSWQHMPDLDVTQWPSVIGKGNVVNALPRELR